MTDTAPERGSVQDDADGAAHVFDQTNGVLGPEQDRPGRDGRDDDAPPSSFGVPPVVSL